MILLDHGSVGIVDILTDTEFLGAVFNFALLLFVLHRLLSAPLSEFLKNRRKHIEDQLLEAQRAKELADAKYLEYSKRLEQLDHEVASLKAEMVRAGEAERDRILADAEQKAARLRREADFVFDQRFKQLRIDLTREVAEKAVLAAETLLREQTTEADRQRLAQEYLGRLGGGTSLRPSALPQEEGRAQ